MEKERLWFCGCQSELVTGADAEDPARIQIHWRNDGAEGRGNLGVADLAGNLANARIEGKVWVLALGDADRVIERGGDMAASRNEQAEVLDVVRLLGEACRRDDGGVPWAGQRDTEPAEKSAAETRRLPADAVDRGIRGLPADVEQQRRAQIERGFGNGNIDVFIGVRRVVDGACHEVVAGADDEACSDAGHPVAAEGILFEYNALAVEDVHAAVFPQAAEVGVVAIGMGAACVTELDPVGDAFRDTTGHHVANHVPGVDVVESDGRMREDRAFGRLHHVGRWSDKPTRLAFQREVLARCCDARYGEAQYCQCKRCEGEHRLPAKLKTLHHRNRHSKEPKDCAPSHGWFVNWL